MFILKNSVDYVGALINRNAIIVYYFIPQCIFLSNIVTDT